MTTTDLFRPVLTLVCGLALLLAATGLPGCAGTPAGGGEGKLESMSKFERDRAAILGMAGEFDVTFDFEETLALRPGYELAEPYQSKASEMVRVIADTGEFISLQHILLVKQGEESHVVKHWRQDWQYEGRAGYDFEGKNVWVPITFDADEARGGWVQSVYQVDDSPRYWGLGKWTHRDGVSTWSAATNRPLPRREFSRRDDYQVLGAVNTHVVTDAGWMHYQSNHKIDKTHPTHKVIALESGVNTYTKTQATDFTEAEAYWENTRAYWAQVRAAWSRVYARHDRIALKNRWKGDKMYTHLFDLSDLYWGESDVSGAKAEVQKVIEAFLAEDKAAQP